MAKKNGRPLAVINQKQFEDMCSILCTREEICQILNVDMKTIGAWCKRTYGQPFSSVYEEKTAGGKMSLRRRQWQLALKGNVVMCIWLGKQWLGQRDTPAEVKDVEVIPAPVYTVLKVSGS